MRSAWERMTGGLCNLNLPEVRRKQKTARQLKEEMRAQLQHVERKFDKIAALDAQCTPESRKEKRRMADAWLKRGGSDTRGFYDRAAARAAKRAAA